MTNTETTKEPAKEKTAGIVSLGCDKNRVDTENMLSYLTKAGFRLTNQIDEAQVLIVNTCAFISSAREEAIDTILELAGYKQRSCEKLIVTGCLPRKHGAELFESLPEVDAFLGTADYNKLPEIIESLYNGADRAVVDESSDRPRIDRVLSTPAHYAYLKIAEGCDNRCTYCTIPSIRGAYRSRSIESLADESKMLADRGVKELILVAQDVTRFGSDRGGSELLALLDRLDKVDGLKWIRLMYCYPEMVSDELIRTVSENPRIAKYMDIPMQHADDRILRLMNRRSTADGLQRLIDRIREIDGEIALRSTFMVGFPGETEEYFNNLCGFISRNKLDHMGFFAYSKEEGTPSYRLAGQISKKEKLRRIESIGALGAGLMNESNRKYLGKTLEVLYEGIDFDKGLFYGRSQFQAPDIDSLIYFKGEFADVGNIYNVKISEISGYDLIGEKV